MQLRRERVRLSAPVRCTSTVAQRLRRCACGHARGSAGQSCVQAVLYFGAELHAELWALQSVRSAPCSSAAVTPAQQSLRSGRGAKQCCTTHAWLLLQHD